MIKFIHYEIPNIEQINGPSGRLYKTPEGQCYPSVSTVLGALPNIHIAAWKEKVGEDIARQISRKATDRGTKIHAAAENFLLDREYKWSPFDTVDMLMFMQMKPHLEKFEEVHALEGRLWSDRLRVAGTVDAIAKIEGQMYVVDFKTSGRYKSKEDIHSYFHQTAAYALCFYERTGVVVDKIRIIMTTEDNGVLIFDEPVKPWLKEFIEIRKILP